MPTPFALRYGPWAVVTGARAVVTGASSGIGRAMAASLAACGIDTVLVARREDTLATLASDLAVRHGIDARPVAADLSRPEGVVVVEE